MKITRYHYAFLAHYFITVAGISTDIYLPSLPAISHAFTASKTMVQLTVTAFMLAMGLLQFIAGPICDAVGRKKMLVFALLTRAPPLCYANGPPRG